MLKVRRKLKQPSNATDFRRWFRTFAQKHRKALRESTTASDSNRFTTLAARELSTTCAYRFTFYTGPQEIRGKTPFQTRLFDTISGFP